MKRRIVIGAVVLTMIAAGGLSVSALPQIMQERDDAYRLEGQTALSGLAFQIYMQQRSGNELPTAEDFVLDETTSLRFEDGRLTSRDGNYVIDFTISPGSRYVDTRGVERTGAYVARATSVDPKRIPDCAWYTIDSSFRHAGGPAADCWNF
jgi:hypothetical protein